MEKRKYYLKRLMLLPFVFMTSCITVEDIILTVPPLFITSLLISYLAVKTKRPVKIYLLSIVIFSFLLILYFLISNNTDIIEPRISSYISYYFLQVIPFLIYTGVIATLIHFISRSRFVPFKFPQAGIYFVIPPAIVFIIYLAMLFSGGCIECEISDSLRYTFGWTFDLLDKIF